MIKFEKAQITDSMPDIITKEAWCIAFAYALNKQIRYILQSLARGRTYSGIDLMENDVIDIFATELRTPQYLETFPFETKRALVKETLFYYATAGTKESLKTICSQIFGDSEIVEWNEYEGEAGCFRILTSNPKITEENISEFVKTADDVKRLSAWLDRIELALSAKQETFVGAVLHDGTGHYFTVNVN